jgi:hypothetical protein
MRPHSSGLARISLNSSFVAAVGGGRAGLIIYPKDNLAIILFTNLGARSVELIIDKIAALYFEN